MENIVSLSVRGLVEFVLRSGSIDSRYSGADRAAEGSRIHRKLQKAAGEAYTPEVSMKATRTVEDITFQLEGRADGVIAEDDGVVIDEIKTTTVPVERLTADFSEVHWAQAKCYAAFYCADHALENITVQLTYYQVDEEAIVRHRKAFTANELEVFLLHTLRRYTQWAQYEASWRALRNTSIDSLSFPFPSYRAGQYRLAGAVYKTIENKGRLFACAPTGIGKTISTLFPAVKALGKGCGQRIFYLTAKTMTRQAAQDAVARLRTASANTLRLKTVTLTAKDKVCFLEQRNCTPEACPYADGYYNRINEALFSFLQTCDDFSRERLEAFARENMLCPFELALDVTSFCDCIICDYNYLFDPVVSLKRFFESGGDFVFLIDEAHNLVSRARDMYSAGLNKSAFYTAKKTLGKTHRKLGTALSKLNAFFIELRHRAEPDQKMLLPQGDEEFAKLLMKFTALAQDWLEENREGEAHAEILQLYFDARFYLRIFEVYDDHFTTLVSVRGSEVRIEQICLDPAPFLDASMALGRASVLFSATLAPADYFIATLGGGDSAKRTQLESPFPAQHLCLLVADSISTKYLDRTDTLPDVCDMIAATITQKQGNYIVFCPSYQYMQDIAALFCEQHPDVKTIMQESNMDEESRESYLGQFSAENKETLVGFCVLGGIFAEGIDLAGERLIGSIVVGVGLPQIGTEQNALKDYYEQTMGTGFAYAYQYPGMNKVLQAAGRVIRTEHDKGVVLLIDARYARSDYRALLPAQWSHARRVSSAAQVGEALQAFWQSV